ncbi:hypothetical protein D3C71_1349950 [compost metagenome]
MRSFKHRWIRVDNHDLRFGIPRRLAAEIHREVDDLSGQHDQVRRSQAFGECPERRIAQAARTLHRNDWRAGGLGKALKQRGRAAPVIGRAHQHHRTGGGGEKAAYQGYAVGVRLIGAAFGARAVRLVRLDVLSEQIERQRQVHGARAARQRL